MSDLELIKSLIKGADVYRKQGLYSEAREKYVEALSYVSKQGDPSLQEKLKEVLEKRIQVVDNEIAEVDKPDELPELGEDGQNLIKKLFSFSETKEDAEIEGAVALMKFGQYKSAMDKFENFLAQRVHSLTAARSIVTCALIMRSPKIAIDRYRQWCDGSFLTNSELLDVRDFLKCALLENGIAAELPFPQSSRGEGDAKEKEEEEPDLSTIIIEFEDGPLKGRTEELKVISRSANVLSVIVPSSKRELTRSLPPGIQLNKIVFYSSWFFFRGSGKVTSKTIIADGQRKGDHIFEISVANKVKT